MIDRFARNGPLLTKLLIAAAMAGIFAGALYLRIAYCHEVVFDGVIPRFTGVDAYWHVRIVDSLVHNFPFLNTFDPYLMFPGGSVTTSTPLFDYLMSFVVWIVGFGSPTQHTVDMVVPFFPPILGALTAIPAYFIGKTLFNRWAGLVAAGLMAFLPGEFLGRSILGFADHHVAETFFSTMAMMFVILALKNVKKEQLSWVKLKSLDGLVKPILYAMLGGLFLGAYLASWQGALLFVFILLGFLVIQACVDHMRHLPVDYLALVGVPIFLSALIIFMSFSQTRNTALVLLGSALLPLLLCAGSRIMQREKLKTYLYPLVIGLLCLAIIGIARGVFPSIVEPLMDNFRIFKWDTGTTVSEMIPMLYQRMADGSMSFSWVAVWTTYKVSLIFGAAGLCILGYRIVQKWSAEKFLFLVWALVLLMATLAQRRFNYYFIVNMVLLNACFVWGIGSLFKFIVKKKPNETPRFKLVPKHVYLVAVMTAICALLYFPVIKASVATATLTMERTRYSPPNAWCESLIWMRDNTPEPFGNPDYYYARYKQPFDYSKYPNAYSVMSWWDYGWWVVRIAHRPPAQNPGGVIPAVAEFFLSQNESFASEVCDTFKVKYVVLDYDFTIGKFYGAISATGAEQSLYFDQFVVSTTTSGKTSYSLQTYFLPAYYRSITSRLYFHNGEAVTPKSIEAIRWEWKQTDQGSYKAVMDRKTFGSYLEAEAFIASESQNWLIIGTDPALSPVPLGALSKFSLVHDSTAVMQHTSAVAFPQVRIFEYEGE